MKKIIHKLSAIVVASFIITMAGFSEDVLSKTGALPKGSPILIDDFEDGNYWIYASDDWDYYGEHKYSIAADLSKKWKSSGKYSLKCVMAPTYMSKDWSGLFYTEGEYSFKDLNYIVIKIYNPNETGFGMMFTFQSAEWSWDQPGEYHWISQGEHTLVYDISEFPDKDKLDVRRIIFMFHGYLDKELYFYLDDLQGYK